MVTNAPRWSSTPGTAGTGGRGRPASRAASVARGRAPSAARSGAVRSRSPMGRLSPADGVGAVQLLVQDDSCQLMRQREGGEAPDPFRPLQRGGRQPVGAAQCERDVATVPLPAGGPVGQLARGPLVSLLRQRDETQFLSHCPQEARLLLHFPPLHPPLPPAPPPL